jgi:hypothetical protein
MYEKLKEQKEDNKVVSTRGRKKIDNAMRTTTASRRAIGGKLSVIAKRCLFCGHHKAFRTITKTRCTRCNMTHQEKKKNR